MNTKTDKEKLTNLLTEFGVGFQDRTYNIKCGGFAEYTNVSGYNGFFTLFEFDDNGKFIQMGAWE